MLNYRKIYTLKHKLSAVFMMVALLWLTVSTPFVFAASQKMAKEIKTEKKQLPATDTEEESTPLGNNTEEKAPNTNTFSEEFLHNHPESHYFLSKTSSYNKCADAATYVAFHGELLVPPPNAA
jgi:hypothetical protein